MYFFNETRDIPMFSLTQLTSNADRGADWIINPWLANKEVMSINYHIYPLRATGLANQIYEYGGEFLVNMYNKI